MMGTNPKLEPNVWLVVLDLEATCGLDVPWYEKEIIEVRAIVVSVVQQTAIAEFHAYVRPATYTAPLDPLCLSLTGVTQAQVDAALPFRRVWKDLVAFCAPYERHGLVVSVDDWDVTTMLPAQCARDEVPLPAFFRRHITLKSVCKDVFGSTPADVIAILLRLQMPLAWYYDGGITYGRHLVAIVIHLLTNGVIFETESQRKHRHYSMLAPSTDVAALLPATSS
ncbi:hypothetical protein SPRG_09338 [Saprolegnia parasitica CBS 223.65]|uniref:Exonuclease domain-containing protein n=1 Tax=Saprolegnia parasitica (strain CBS 223.65) TaxID=695850 RepID=A0A067CFR9_SAPPC|nr:hypothetical protein SPRG_09338 [Saprolegnia parasitica CBS 223.65]KDO25396.1 hypothetical protein SPRG_09338 [Saprolegnia parasitica CBS 223.65]|eukprot:XP_012203824.1 hypothetical protein SPRG_09338 [Saprolegnia parasitica CBS 223.65]